MITDRISGRNIGRNIWFVKRITNLQPKRPQKIPKLAITHTKLSERITYPLSFANQPIDADSRHTTHPTTHQPHQPRQTFQPTNENPEEFHKAKNRRFYSEMSTYFKTSDMLLAM